MRFSKDIVGSDQKSHEAVLAGRTAFFTRIIDIAYLDRQFRFNLSSSPDGYCRSCAIGNHCKKTFFHNFSLNRDLIYKRILGVDYVTAEQLFDPEFYKLLGSEAKRQYPSWFSDLPF